MKYTVDATVTITLEQVILRLDESASEELDFHDALLQKLRQQLVLLDIKGARTGDDGVITAIECESIDNCIAD